MKIHDPEPFAVRDIADFQFQVGGLKEVDQVECTVRSLVPAENMRAGQKLIASLTLILTITPPPSWNLPLRSGWSVSHQTNPTILFPPLPLSYIPPLRRHL